MSQSKLITFVVLSFFVAGTAHCQKQLVLLKGEKVVLRLYPGDEFKFRKKTEKRVITSYVNNILEDAVVIHRDTIPFNKIDRIYFRRNSGLNAIGGTLIAAGILYFGIDQLNTAVIQDNPQGIDHRVRNTSIGLVGIGLPLFLMRKNYQKIGYRFRLRMVAKGSAFYRPDVRENSSAFQN